MDGDKWVVHKKGRTCLARKYLAVQVTSASSERLFSTAGNTVTVKRARLSDDNVKNIVFLHSSQGHSRFAPCVKKCLRLFLYFEVWSIS